MVVGFRPGGPLLFFASRFWGVPSPAGYIEGACPVNRATERHQWRPVPFSTPRYADKATDGLLFLVSWSIGLVRMRMIG